MIKVFTTNSEGNDIMAEYFYNNVKVVKPGDIVTTLPPPITTVTFNVRFPGTFKVIVQKDGSWTVEEL